jgi:dTMP kinase
MKHLRNGTRGLFIAFEGVEGCGKSTQIIHLKHYLESQGYDVSITREPGGTPIGETIRSILLDPGNEAMSGMTEALLYEAARAQHVAERIQPALAAGQIVLSDRFADSTTAYQCGGRGLSREGIDHLHTIATGGLWPDLTIVLDVPVTMGLERAKQQSPSDRIESEPLAFHERVREAFLTLARQEPHRVKVVDGTRNAAEVAAEIRGHVDPLLRRP